MAKTYEVAFRIGASIAGGFAQTMKGASGALNTLNSQIKSIGDTHSANKKLIELRKTVGNSSREYIKAKENVAALGKELSNTKNPTKEMQREFEKAQNTVSKAKKRLEGQRVELGKLNTQMGATGKRTADLVKEQERLARSGDKAKKAQESLQRTMAAQQKNLADRANYRGQMMDTVALAVSAGAPVKQAMDWEQKLAEFNKVAGLGEAEVQKFANAAQNLAIETGVSSDQIMGAYIAAAQAGFPIDEWEEYAVVASRMGVAFDTTGDAAGEMIKNWRAGMGLTMKEAEMMAAAANHIANNMNAVATDVGEVLQRQGAVLKAAGLTNEQAAALSASLLSGGAGPEKAATAAKNFANALTKSFAATKQQKDIWMGMGFDPKKLAVDMQNDAERTIKRVLNAISKQDTDKQNAIVGVLFGEESKGAIMPLIQNLELLDKSFGFVSDQTKYISSLDDEFEAMGNTTQQQLKKAGESLKAISVTIGSAVLPSLNKFLKKASEVGRKVADWMKENKGLVSTITTVVTSLVALKVALFAGGYAFTFVKGAVLTAVTGFKVAKIALATLTSTTKLMSAAQAVFNTVMLANPIGLVTLAVIGLVAVGILLWKKWDVVVAFFKSAWVGFKEGIDPIIEAFSFLTPVIDAIGTAFSWVTEKLKTLVGWLFTTESSAESLETASEYGRLFGQVVGTAFSALFAPIQIVIDVVEYLVDLFPSVYDTATEIFGSIGDFFSGLNFFDSGAKIMSTIKDGILSAGSAVVDSVKGVFSTIRDFLPFSDAKVGPLSELTKSGRAIMETLADGVGEYDASEMGREFQKVADHIDEVVNPKFSITSGFNDLAREAREAKTAGSITITVPQNITIQGGDRSVYEQAKKGAADGAAEFEKRVAKMLARERRLSYG